jgi:hypothetical protein
MRGRAMAQEMGRGKPEVRRALPIMSAPSPMPISQRRANPVPLSQRRATPQELAAMTAIITDAANRYAKARAAAEAKRRTR